MLFNNKNDEKLTRVLVTLHKRNRNNELFKTGITRYLDRNLESFSNVISANNVVMSAVHKMHCNKRS